MSLEDFMAPNDDESPSLDLKARRIVVASVLYYGLDLNMMTDHEFDALCQECARRWSELSDVRQWQLGSPDEIRASGFHVKVTQAALGGVRSYLESIDDKRPVIVTADEQTDGPMSWYHPTDFRIE